MLDIYKILCGVLSALTQTSAMIKIQLLST